MNPNASRSPDPADLLRTALGSDEKAVPWVAPALADLAPAFPDLTLHELVGQGGMAAVYRATQTRLGRPVALKVMRSDLASQPQFVERFVREARALAALSNPHVLAIHDFGERAGFCYLVTEFVDGANLRELMQIGKLSPAEVLRIVPQICAGLHFAHQHGVVHRDIKPENVLVDRQGLVKLVDFGLAKLAGDPGRPGLTGSGVVFGTPHYMAPEQWHGSAAVDHRADIYSLGVVLYELLTGRLPVGTYAPASHQPGVPSGIDQVVQRSLQQEPERRYQSARDVQRDVEQQGQGLPRTAAPATGATHPHRRVATRLLLAAAALLLVGAGLLVTLLQVRMNGEAARWYYQRELAHAASLMTELRTTVAAGTPWKGDVPGELEPPVPTPFDEVPVPAIGTAWAIAITALVLVLAAAAARRTTPAGTSRVEFVLARLLLWSPLLGALIGGLSTFAGHYANASNGMVPFVVMLTIFGGLVALGRALWRASAQRTSAAPVPMSAFAKSAAVVAALVAVGCVVAVVLAPRSSRTLPTLRVPIEAGRLVGMSRVELLDRLGPPLQVQTAANSTRWSYRALDGQSHEDALLLVNGVVARADHPAVQLVPELPAPAGAHLGQSLAELLRALGPATETTNGAAETELTFGDGTRVRVGPDGIVFAVRR